MKNMKKSISFIVLFISVITMNAQLGQITAIKDSNGQNLGGAEPQQGETYTVEFTGQNIRDLHIKLPKTTASVCYHSGSIPNIPNANCDIDVSWGSFNIGSTFNAVYNNNPTAQLTGPYISLYLNPASGPLTAGSFQIRVNTGKAGLTGDIVFTKDGDANPFNGVVGVDFDLDNLGLGVPVSVPEEVVPTLSEWGVIVLILLTLAVGMVFLYRRETALALAGNLPTESSAPKPKLFDKYLYAKVFGVILLIGLALLGLSYLYFGEITSADPLGTFVSSAIVAYMVHFWMLRKSQSE